MFLPIPSGPTTLPDPSQIKVAVNQFLEGFSSHIAAGSITFVVILALYFYFELRNKSRSP